jgi:hypothetical protein
MRLKHAGWEAEYLANKDSVNDVVILRSRIDSAMVGQCCEKCELVERDVKAFFMRMADAERRTDNQ